MLRPYNPSSVLAMLLLDLSLILLALVVATWVRAFVEIGENLPPDQIIVPWVIPLVLLVWGGTFLNTNIYNALRPVDWMRLVFTSNSLALGIFVGLLYFSIRDISRLWVIYFYGFCLLGCYSWRILAWKFFRQSLMQTRRVIIIGQDRLAVQAAEAILRQPDLQLIGYIGDDKAEALGTLDEIKEIVTVYNADMVILALPMEAHHKLGEIVIWLQHLSIQVWLVADYFNLTMSRLQAQSLDDILFVNLREPALTSSQRLMKRTFDLVIASVLCIFLLPIMAVIALIIWLDSPGAVIFKQKRVGENNRLFTMYKFRSMLPDAEKRQGEVMYQTETGEIVHKVANDPRVTRIGAVLRRTSLDELPQIFNVLKGDMSLVGPRPEMPWLVDKYRLWQRKRFTVPPGITGWWQINGRSDRLMHLHTEDDLYYIQNYSFWLDFYILLRTIPTILGRKGAY